MGYNIFATKLSSVEISKNADVLSLCMNFELVQVNHESNTIHQFSLHELVTELVN